MRWTFLALSFSVAICSAKASHAQFQTGGFGGGQTGGFGGGGFGGGAVGGGATGGAASQSRLPGAFGGLGVTGTPVLEYSRINAAAQFGIPSQSGAPSGGAGGTGGGTTGFGGAPAGGSPFGANAFGGGTLGAGGLGGGIGGLGGGLGGLGGGFGGGLGGLGGIGGLGGLGGSRNRNQLGGGRNANGKGQIRAVVRPDIEFNQDARNTSFNTIPERMARLPLPERLRNISATVESGVVVLRGTALTESDKRMVEKLVMLEPGVTQVQNEVSVLTKPAETIEATPNR
ncbi:BON domain-containing protein [Pirellulaceae bacterium SH467]